MSLTTDQWARYARHLSLDAIGVDGQEKLLRGRVLLIGAGGLGSPALLYLAAAGVGTIGIVDEDHVEMSNLQRQVAHTTRRVGMLKIESAQAAIHDINPDVKVVPLNTRFTSKNALDILADFDILIDGSDNFPTRYLTNDACVLAGKPNIFSSVQAFDGQASVFWPGGPQGGPCYRCLFPEPPPPGAVPTCAEGGVLGILPGMMGMIQATEAIKIILGYGETLAGRLLLYDAARMSFRSIAIRRNPACPVCGDSPSISELIDYEHFCSAGAPGARSKSQEKEESEMEQITVEALKKRMDAGEDLVILDVRNPDEHEKGTIPGARLTPLPELQKVLDDMSELKNREVIVHCQKGGRSSKACVIMKNRGFENPVNVEGGYEAWQKLTEYREL